MGLYNDGLEGREKVGDVARGGRVRMKWCGRAQMQKRRRRSNSSGAKVVVPCWLMSRRCKRSRVAVARSKEAWTEEAT